MQGLQFTIPTLQDHGPIIEAEIHTDEDTFLHVKNLKGFHTYITTRLLIDTGSNISGLDKTIIQRLKLNQYRDDATVDGAGGRYELKLFRGILYLPIFREKALPIDLVEGDYSNAPYDGIIGRDVLRYCSFVYDGWSHTFKLMAVDV
ncbi:aspartyl protease family protein [Sediminibacterium sp.]|jgi:hypothetical protein|uniref:aspartyl protease family protein n=1 Tax=Sediminibacterium sp. TaxID=1917865 RepID=UPI0025F50C24|nr:aspartyl protease family protein [Sediminibacterium sp.]MBW0176533.1 aspartyl protease family protein [Sediminibacterium sp.]